VHGDVDTRVDIEHSRKLVAELERLDKPYRYIEQSNGNHHLSQQNHRHEFLVALEEFLSEHIGLKDEHSAR